MSYSRVQYVLLKRTVCPIEENSMSFIRVQYVCPIVEYNMSYRREQYVL